MAGKRGFPIASKGKKEVLNLDRVRGFLIPARATSNISNRGAMMFGDVRVGLDNLWLHIVTDVTDVTDVTEHVPNVEP